MTWAQLTDSSIAFRLSRVVGVGPVEGGPNWAYFIVYLDGRVQDAPAFESVEQARKARAALLVKLAEGAP